MRGFFKSILHLLIDCFWLQGCPNVEKANKIVEEASPLHSPRHGTEEREKEVFSTPHPPKKRLVGRAKESMLLLSPEHMLCLDARDGWHVCTEKEENQGEGTKSNILLMYCRHILGQWEALKLNTERHLRRIWLSICYCEVVPVS